MGEGKARFPQVRHPGDFRAVFSLPLNGSIITLSVTPAIFKPGSTAFKTSGFPIKNFGNDERGVTPATCEPFLACP